MKTTEAVAMIETNALAMTDEFLRNSWRNAFNYATTRPEWAAIRDAYAAELDRRELAPRDAHGSMSYTTGR